MGSIKEDETQIFELPLPPSLAGEKVWRRLTITLSWLTPIQVTHGSYKKAGLSFSPPDEELKVKRQEVDHHTVKKGTIQHEVLEGDKASAFIDGDKLFIEVSCRAITGAGSLNEDIPYSLLVSLDVKEDVSIPIYNEIRDRVSVPLGVKAA